jgi:predicted patatin/cPLA2 family phospholipase
MSAPHDPLYLGSNADAAIANIRARAAARKLDPDAKDQRKLALVVEGGSMRGVLSAGGVVALSYLGYNDLFDEVFATSAGVMNVGYLLSRQAELGITVYFESLLDRRFWSPRRFWKMLDIDYLFRDVVAAEKPLKVDVLLESRSRLLVAALDIETAEGTVFDTKTVDAPLLDVLKAATAIPILYNRSVVVQGRHYVDGGLAIPFPLQAAIDRGATDVLVLLTRPPAYRSPHPNWQQRLLFRRMVHGNKRKLAELFARHATIADAARDLALGKTKPSRPVNIVTVCPDLPELITRTTQDPNILHAGAFRYGRKLLTALGEDPMGWTLAPLRG